MKYVSITIVYDGNNAIHCNKCWGAIDPMSCDVVFSKAKMLNYTDAMRELRRLERRLHKTAELDVNFRDYHLSAKTLWGWVSEGA